MNALISLASSTELAREITFQSVLFSILLTRAEDPGGFFVVV